VFLARLVAGLAGLELDPAASLEHLAAAETILPGTAQVPFFQGKAWERLRRQDEAVEAYREAVRRDPEGEVGRAAAARLAALGAR
jgi:predicted TPR repeat methyltransferase